MKDLLIPQVRNVFIKNILQNEFDSSRIFLVNATQCNPYMDIQNVISIDLRYCEQQRCCDKIYRLIPNGN